MLQNRWQIDLS